MSKPRRRGGAFPQKVRCKAKNRWGEQCRKWAMKGSVVCNKHGGAAPQVRRKAAERIAMAQDDAASLLIKFMADDEVPYSERRRCAEYLLNYENRNQVELMLKPYLQGIDGLIYETGKKPAEDIVDAEIVEEDHRGLPIGHSDLGDDEGDYDIANHPPRYGRGNRLRGR